VDLNNDGYTDIVSGKYYPNDVTWFKGSKDGFEKGIIIKEDRLKNDGKKKNHVLAMSMYKCTPHFVDIDGDKDLDMFITDFNVVYLNRNIGSPENPKFGRREILTTIEGDTIGSTHPTIAILDWDKDNILDIVITDEYKKEGDVGLSYYKGLGNEKFETKVPIVKNKKGKRYIPGHSYWICSTDWNNDGKPDILVGSSLMYKNGKPLEEYNNTTKDIFAQIRKSTEKMNQFFKDVKSYSYVYLLLGK
jgi:hypothetical protein